MKSLVSYKINPHIFEQVQKDFSESVITLANTPDPEAQLLACQVWIDGDTLNAHFHLIGVQPCSNSKPSPKKNSNES